MSRQSANRITGPWAVCTIIAGWAACALLATAAPAPAQTCTGDCNGNGSVSDDETLLGATVALGMLDLRSCPAADASGDGGVRVHEAVAAVGQHLAGCGLPRASARVARTASPQVELGMVAGSAGAQVVFEATLHTMGNDVAGIQNDIAFDPLTRIVSCEADPSSGKDVFSGFQPPGCTPGVDCTAIRLLVLSFTDVDPIPDGSVVYRCTVAINAGAPDGTYPLDSFNEGASTPDGVALPLEGIDGAVTVIGAVSVCAGDCDGNGFVTINEIIVAINLLLNGSSPTVCPAVDGDGNGAVTVDEVVAADGNAREGCGTHPTGSLGTTPIEIQIGVVSGTAGTEVVVDATIDTNGQAVAGTQNEILFDPFTPIVACDANPAINKGGTSFAFMPNGCTPGVNCFGVRALVVGLGNSDPIPDGAVLYSCTIDISPFAPDGTHPLTTAGPRASTIGGQPQVAFAIDGAVITTGGGFPPTPTPTPDTDTTIVVGDASGVPGQLTTVAVGLTTDAEIAGVQNDMFFDAAAPIVFSSCAVNPEINKQQTVFGFRPFDCVPGVNCSGVRAIVISFSNLDPIPSGSTMYSCEVFIVPSAAPGDYPLVCSNEGVSDPVGNALPVECTDGTVTVLPAGPPVAPASLILQKTRLRARSSGGAVVLSGAVNANPPFDGLGDDVLTGGLTMQLGGAGGVDATLAWAASACSTRQTTRGPRIRCEVTDEAGKRKITLRPTRFPNLLRLRVSGSRLELAGPFTADPVSATLATASFQRPDTLGGCEVRHGGQALSCVETGVVP